MNSCKEASQHRSKNAMNVLFSMLSGFWQPAMAPSNSIVSLPMPSPDTVFREAHAFLQWPQKSESSHGTSIHQKLRNLLALSRERQSSQQIERHDNAVSKLSHSNYVHLPLEMVEAIANALLDLKHYRTFFHFVTCSKSMLCYAVRTKKWLEMIQRYQIHVHLRQLEVAMGVPEHSPSHDGYKEWIEEAPQIESLNQLFNRWKAALCKFGWQGSFRTRDSEMIHIADKHIRPLQTPCLDELVHLTDVLEKNGRRMHQVMIYFQDTLLKQLFSRIELDFVDFDVDKELQCDSRYADSPLQWDHLSRRFLFYEILCNRLMLCIARNEVKNNMLPLGEKVIVH